MKRHINKVAVIGSGIMEETLKMILARLAK